MAHNVKDDQSAHSEWPPEPLTRRAEDAAPSNDTTRSVRAQPSSPRASHVYEHQHSLSEAMSSDAEAHSPKQSQHSRPILRWFSGRAERTTKKSGGTPPQSRPTTPLQYSDSPAEGLLLGSSATALTEALHDDPRLVEAHSRHHDLLTRAQVASSPPTLRSWRSPSHLSELARSTPPTVSLSPASSFYRALYTDPGPSNATLGPSGFDSDLDTLFSPTTIPHSSGRAHKPSSIDALRSIQERTKIKHEQHYISPSNPMVFCHGLMGWDTVALGPIIQIAHWRGIKDALEANGVEVLITRVPATSSPIVRAKILEEKVSQVYPGRSVHLIGHSMGGLDCRYLTTHLTNRKFKVLSVTTISTPHHGSASAEYFVKTIGIERMSTVSSLLNLLPIGDGDGKAFEFLTVDNMRKFNEETPDVPGVKYFSWGAAYEPGLIDSYKWSHSIIYEKEGPNDGQVSVESAKWGTYLGTLEGVNHMGLVGWVNPASYKWAEVMGREIKFKPTTFYLAMADYLARAVEGQGHPQELPEAINEGGLSKADREEREEIRQEGERVEMVESLGRISSEDERQTMDGIGSSTLLFQNSSWFGDRMTGAPLLRRIRGGS